MDELESRRGRKSDAGPFAAARAARDRVAGSQRGVKPTSGRFLWSVCLALCLCAGCQLLGGGDPAASTPAQLLPNPIELPAVDRDFLWEQLIDSVDDYFEIAHEQRLQMVGNVLMEGRLETHPLIGATYFERWLSDSTPGYERWLSTLQSVRRKAEIRVIPIQNAYQVQVHVFKELEELNQPENSTIGMATQRHDGTLIRPGDPTREGPLTLSWIPIGRDVSLEQEILKQLQARVVDNGEYAPELREPHHLPR